MIYSSSSLYASSKEVIIRLLRGVNGEILKAKRCDRIGNLLGSIEISRALGDRAVKEYHSESLIATPDIVSMSLKKGDIIIVASDGVWDVLSSQEAVDFVVEHLKMSEKVLAMKFSEVVFDCSDYCKDNQSWNRKIFYIARGLRDLATEKESTDNISVVLLEIQDIV